MFNTQSLTAEQHEHYVYYRDVDLMLEREYQSAKAKGQAKLAANYEDVQLFNARQCVNELFRLKSAEDGRTFGEYDSGIREALAEYSALIIDGRL